MHAIIATFARRESAEAFVSALQERLGVASSIGTVGAWGELWDGDALVSAWVTTEQIAIAREMAVRAGGMLHEGPTTASPEAK